VLFLKERPVANWRFSTVALKETEGLLFALLKFEGKFMVIVVAVDTILCFKTNKNGRQLV